MERYYATDGTAVVWKNLPARLEQKLVAMLQGGDLAKKPKVVALGVDEDFVYLDSETAEWELKNYPELEGMLRTLRGQSQIHHISVCVLFTCLLLHFNWAS